MNALAAKLVTVGSFTVHHRQQPKPQQTRRRGEHEIDPAEYCATLFKEAQDSLQVEVLDLVRHAFDAFAVKVPKPRPTPASRSLSQRPRRSSTSQPQTEPVVVKPTTIDKGVPVDQLPDLLNIVGCPATSAVVSRR